MSDDRRRDARRDACRVGSLRTEDGASEVACLVWDLSGSGAHLEVEAAVAVPDRFMLLVSAYEPPRACTVVRREGRRLGVRFDA